MRRLEIAASAEPSRIARDAGVLSYRGNNRGAHDLSVGAKDREATTTLPRQVDVFGVPRTAVAPLVEAKGGKERRRPAGGGASLSLSS